MFTWAFIFVFVIVALGKFSFAYCRTLLATYSKVELSGKGEDIMGLTANATDPREFNGLMVLVRVAPDTGDASTEIAAVGLYYRVIRIARAITSLLSASASNWWRR
jgi:hypothetical protein